MTEGTDAKDVKAKSTIQEWYDIFRKYPDVFPDAYFRFLRANLDESHKKGTFIYKNGVLLTWKQYKKTVNYAKPGDYALEKMVSKNPGNGKAQKVMEQFLSGLPKGSFCYLKVAANNERAICFYKRNGFKRVSSMNFGSVPGVLMRRKN
jgi:hypothetical protein